MLSLQGQSSVGIIRQSEGRESLYPIMEQPHRKIWPPLLHQVVRTVRTRNLFQPGHHLLVAVSGGPDSIALLSLLNHLRASWALTLTAVHCNYGLRGVESEDDQSFVTARCRELRIPLHVRRFPLFDRPQRSSIQAMAREVRYQAFAEIADQCGADRIALGHTENDQAETILLWLLRGAGLDGLAGMPAVRAERIIRPLYETGRQDILDYLEDAGLQFREDSTNAKPLYLRNRIRHELVPIFNRLAPSSLDALCRLADIYREDARYLDQQTAAWLTASVTWRSDTSWALDRERFREVSPALQRRVIRDLIRKKPYKQSAVGVRTVDRIIRMATTDAPDSRLDIQGGRLTVTNDHLRFIPHHQSAIDRDRQRAIQSPQRLSMPGSLIWAGTGQRLQVCFQAYGHRPVQQERHRIVVDADRISQPLTVRGWSPGDRFQPSGMHGHSKKLQDFFMDLKIPRSIRPHIPLVVAPEGIVWVVGYRQDQRWLPTTATERCLVVTADDLPLKEGTE